MQIKSGTIKAIIIFSVLLITILAVSIVLIRTAIFDKKIQIEFYQANGEIISVQKVTDFNEIDFPYLENSNISTWVLKEDQEITFKKDVFDSYYSQKASKIAIIENLGYAINYTNIMDSENTNVITNVSKDGESFQLKALQDTENYCFLGWAVNGEIVTSINPSDYSGDIEIEARWVPKYTITIVGQYSTCPLFTSINKFVLGETFTYTISDILGYKYKNYSINGTNYTGTEINVTVDKNIEIVIDYELEMFNMPIVFIETKNHQEIVDKENYVTSSVSILNTQDSWVLNEEDAKVRYRGNFSLTYPKKGFRIKFSQTTSVLGSAYAAKSWALIPNYVDRSLSRNYVAHELAEAFADINFASKHDYVELYVNGEYLGVYLLCDQIQTGEGRVDIDESYENELEPGNVGYLIEMDGYAPDEGTENIDYVVVDSLNYAIKTPDTESKKYDANICATYIKAYLTDCINAIKGDDWNEVIALMDVNSFADTYIISEIVTNPDIDWSSFYFYKDKSGKLTSGPIWDFDLGAGNCNFDNDDQDFLYSSTKEIVAGEINIWYKNLLRFNEFKAIIVQKLSDYKSIILDIADELYLENPSGLYAIYKDSFERNFERWQMYGIVVYPSPRGMATINGVAAHLTYVKDWIISRYYYIVDYYS